MEDGVTEAQSLLPPLNLNPKDEENASTFVAKHEVQEEPVTDTGGGENGAGEGGIISNLVSNLFHTSGGVGIIENEKDDEDKVPRLETPPTAAGSGGGGENGGGERGIINNLVFNLFQPTEGVGVIGNEKNDEDEMPNIETPPQAAGSGGDDGGENGGGEGGGKGIINNLISNLFRPTENGDTVEIEKDDEEKKVRVVEENEELKRNGDKGGIIDNVVSHIPTSLPDDAVPTSDEATILINSLVRD